MNEIQNHRIDSKDTRISISRSHLDNHTMDQENEQQSKSEFKINKDSTYAVNNTSMDNRIAIINRGKGLQAESEPTLNHEDNVNKKLNIKLKSKNIESTRKTYHSSSNKADNNLLTHKFKLIIIKHVPTNVQASDSCNNNVNDTKEQELMQIQTRSIHESITQER